MSSPRKSIGKSQTNKHEAAKRSQSAPEPSRETKTALQKAGAEIIAGRVKNRQVNTFLTPEVLVTLARDEEEERQCELQYQRAVLGAFGTRRSYSNLSISFNDKTSILRQYHSDPCLVGFGFMA